MTSLTNKTDLTSPSTTEAAFQVAIGALHDVVREMPGGDAPQTIAVSDGSIVPSTGIILVDTEASSASTDNLDNIVPTNLGQKLLYIQAANTARTVVLRHNQAGSGKLLLKGGVDASLDDDEKSVLLRYDQSLDAWVELQRSWATLGDHEDVDTTTTPPTNGDGLVFNGTNWVPRPTFGPVDTTTTPPTNGDGLVYNGTNWVPSPTPGQNAIINGDFRFNQRGAASYSGSVYGLDRWLGNAVGSSLTHSQQSFTLGQTDVPGEPKNYARCFVSSVAGASNNAIYVQRIEGVRTFAGQTVTLSFCAKADAAKNIAVELAQNFGTGGSPSPQVNSIGVSKKSLTTAWQQFSVTVTLPSISGKTLGTAGNDNLILLFWMDAGSDWNARTNTLGQQSGTFEFADVQLKLGSTVTPYDRIDDATELARCQRYYVNGIFRIQSAAVDASGMSGGRVTFPTFMRAAPTVIATSTFLTNSAAAATDNPASDGFDVVASALAMGTPQTAGGTWTADAEF